MRESSMAQRAAEANQPSGSQRQRYKETAYSQDSGLANNHLLKKDLKDVRLTWLDYEHPTTFRIFPGINPDNGDWDAWRLSPDPNDWGTWILTLPTAHMVGSPGVSFFLYDSADKSAVAEENPYWMLYSAVTEACRKDPHCDPTWIRWLGTKLDKPKMTKPKAQSLVQCCVYQRDGKLFPTPKGGAVKDSLYVMLLGKSATEALFAQMEQRVQGYTGDLNDFEKAYIHGDPVALEYGAFVTMFKEGEAPSQARARSAERRPSSFGRPNDTRGGGDDDNSVKGYDCVLEAEFDGMLPSLADEAAQAILNQRVQEWKNIIHFPTDEEQVRWLSLSFPPNMIMHAFEDSLHRKWIPDNVYAKMANRVASGPEPTTPRTARGFGGAAESAPANNQTFVDNGQTQVAPRPPATTPTRGFGAAAPANERQRPNRPDEAVPKEDLPPPGQTTTPAPESAAPEQQPQPETPSVAEAPLEADRKPQRTMRRTATTAPAATEAPAATAGAALPQPAPTAVAAAAEATERARRVAAQRAAAAGR